MARINIRQKGQQGEREVAKLLNDVVQDVRQQKGLPLFEDRDLPFQRNQNQSAVGGADLSNPFNLEIEVKRQEQLSLGTWWKQCTESASRTGGVPILIYRQSRKPWRVRMFADVPYKCGNSAVFSVTDIQAEMSMEDFLRWFEAKCCLHYDLGN